MLFSRILAACNQGQIDPYAANVVLLMHGEGTDGSKVFVDSSNQSNTFTAKVGSRISTLNKKFGAGALYFDGNTAGVYTNSKSDFAMGSDDFTVECFVYATANVDQFSRIVNFGPYWSSADSWSIIVNDFYSRKISLASYKLGASRLCESVTLININTWYHVAVTRSGGVFRLFVDGVLESTNSSYIGIPIETSTTNICCIGGAYDLSEYEDFAGYIDEFRITKGVARYTENFTPPTAPFPNP